MKSFDPTYKTTDLNLAAFLQSSGVDLMDVSLAGRRRAVFIFRDNPSRQELVVSFFSHRASVEPLSYVAAMRNLKSFAVEVSANGAAGAANV